MPRFRQDGRKDLEDIAVASRLSNDHVEVNNSDIDISVILRTITGLVKQNLLIISSIVVGTVILGIVATLLMTPKYQAASQILIEDQAEQIIEGSDLQQTVDAGETNRFLQTQLGVIRSRALALFIVQGAKLDSDRSFFKAMGTTMPTEAPNNKKIEDVRQDAAIDLLLEALYVDIPDNSRIATLQVTSRSPKLSATLANLYADRFIEYNLNQKYERSSYARQFLANQMEDARANLTQSEHDLNKYARAAGLIRVSSQGENGQQDSTLSVTNGQLVDLNDAAAAATAQRIAAQDSWKAVANQPALSISDVTSNSAIMQLIAARTIAQGTLAQDLSQHRDGYATVQAEKAQIAELNKRIDALAEALKHSIYTNYQTALERENSLSQQVSDLREASLKEQDRSVQYSVLKRVADTNRTLYESLLSRYNQLNASAGSASNNVTIVDRAFVPVKPSSPNLILNIFISLVLGALIAAAVVALRYLLNDGISSPSDIEKKFGLSLLGLIPLRKNVDINKELKNRRSGLGEAYRTLVTNLTYTTTKGFPRVLAITSSRAGEGKSTTSRAIAMDLAALGKKTLLVDADLRKPTLHRVLDDRSQSGLTDVLVGEKTLKEVAQVWPGTPLLSYVTALPIPPDPGLLLANDGMERFLAAARADFDVVVVDCPPLLGLSDVPLIAKHTDGVLFVIDGVSFNQGAIKATLKRLEFVKTNVLGAVLNRYEVKSGSEDYEYYADEYYNYGATED